MEPSLIFQFAKALAAGTIRVVDLSQSLEPKTPIIPLPPEYGASWPFKLEEISKYDDRGPAWYWNNFSCGEHTGAHFAAPVHWVRGKDHPNNTTDTISVGNFIAPACVIDVSREAAADADFLLTRAHVEEWESKHGRIEEGSGFSCVRTDRSVAIRLCS